MKKIFLNLLIFTFFKSIFAADPKIDRLKYVLKKTNFNQVKAAKQLGISNDALFRRIKKYKIKIEKNLA